MVQTFDGPSIPFGSLVESIPIIEKTLKGILLGYGLRAGRGDFMMADYEDLQESQVSEIRIKTFKSQEAFVKGEYEFPCANGTLDVLIVQDRHGLQRETRSRKMMLKIEEGDKMGR